ncbi:MAG TPA: NAD-dependent epimerase/dehydratase family protein [Candidatus Paceibacterota bacterium]
MTKILITGGCGFIGSNAVKYYLQKNYSVLVLDNLSRSGSEQNLKWLRTLKGKFSFKKIDITSYVSLVRIFKEFKPDLILHLAGQTTVVGSILDPREDFEVNALGTFNLLETMRNITPKAALIYSSTNKVMGNLEYVPIIEKQERYIYKNIKNISEKYQLNFHSPYGCSKGCGDQYVTDYAKVFNLNTVVFRQSCIYGPNQFGMEEQGWLAWFIISSLFNKEITIFGNGKQVRDVLYVDDLIDAYDLAFVNINKTKGKIYNIGGGIEFNLSLLESLKIIGNIVGKNLKYNLSSWRTADQKVYISDVALAKKDFGWYPKVSPKDGLKKLYKWVEENKTIFNKIYTR